MRSRRIPALFTTPSTRPKLSSAHWMILPALAHVDTDSAFATASPPASRISRTTRCAADSPSWISPASDAPMSFTTTRAPFAAIAIAMSRPMPPPAPVTTTTLPSTMFPMSILGVLLLLLDPDARLFRDRGPLSKLVREIHRELLLAAAERLDRGVAEALRKLRRAHRPIEIGVD